MAKRKNFTSDDPQTRVRFRSRRRECDLNLCASNVTDSLEISPSIGAILGDGLRFPGSLKILLQLLSRSCSVQE